ncbi:MAG: hypothetical protein IJQ39_00005, partial [Thermoguttaceae bacterium]|nr:hypothetical protein [Thermoguttaceae bacterium]
PFPAPIGAGKGGDFVRYITIYAVLNPTPKGVVYVLVSYLTYFHNPKFIAPLWQKNCPLPLALFSGMGIISA